MSRRRRAFWSLFPRRSPKEWGLRLPLALVVVICGYLSVTHTLSAVLRNQVPASAWRLAPDDGRAAAAYAQSIVLENPTGGDRLLSDKLARRALREDATAVAAAIALAINAQTRGDTASARQLIRFAHSLSRRELQVELWLIEDAVSRGDIPEALRHYDIALRTSRPAAELLYPVLAQAITEPSVRRELVRTLVAQPAWAGSFSDYVSTLGPNPLATAMLLKDLARSGGRVSEGASAATVAGLVAQNHLGEAWALYASLHKAAKRENVRNGQFTMAIVTPSPFDWATVDQSGATADLQYDAKGGLFDFSVPANTGGVLLKQIQLLPAGRYRLVGHSTGIETEGDAQPYWQISCSNGQIAGSVDVPPSNRADGKFGGEVTVPEDCSVQTLTFSIRPSTKIEGVSGQINQVEFIKLTHK